MRFLGPLNLPSAVSVAILLLLVPVTAASQAAIDPALADQYFKEAAALSKNDGGKLWGVSLAGPLLFADPKTRTVAANRGDPEGKLTRQGSVFVGRLSESATVANTSLDWAGLRWTMVMWPLPADVHDRAALLMHESWHRIQDRLGLPAAGPANHHLDTADGRLWLQLEWRALGAALKDTGSERRQAIQAALIFRAARRESFPQAQAEERALEMHEGLAEYTGVRLCGLEGADLHAYMRKKLADRPAKMRTFVRSFAYLSGPAYGLLLDETGTEWRKDLKPTDDLGDLLRRSLSLEPVKNAKESAEHRWAIFDGLALRASERAREDTHRRRLAELRERFIKGPVLVLPLEKMQFKFDPNETQPLGNEGTVYPTMRLSDTWGTLTVSKGALITADFTKAYVPAPVDVRQRPLKGDGWQLELKAGWKLTSGARKGDLVLSRGKDSP
jgi:hypothetical protein